MNRILHNFCQERYSQFETDLAVNWGVDARELARFSSLLKGIHRRQLSLACATTITGLRAARNEYAREIAETSYLSIVLCIKGLENCACVLVRQTIELALKHVYFATHPVEHAWAATRDNYKELSFQTLIDYIKRTDECQTFSGVGTSNLSGPIEDTFATLSRYVHVQSKRFMTYKRIRRPPRASAQALQKFDRVTASLWPALTVMLIVFFPERFAKAQEIEKGLITSTLPREIKASVVSHLRAWQSRGSSFP